MGGTSRLALHIRARRYAALGDPSRLAIVDELARSDRTAAELHLHTGLASNHLSYHLDTLEEAGIVTRCQSSGDRRRRYVCLNPDALTGMLPTLTLDQQPALFICTQNSARSQLAAALWQQLTAAPAYSAGLEPANRVHRSAIAAGRRAGLDLSGAVPQHLDEVADLPALVVTVCDQAHEQFEYRDDWLHWSIPDPVGARTPRAFDQALNQLRARIDLLAGPRQ